MAWAQSFAWCGISAMDDKRSSQMKQALCISGFVLAATLACVPNASAGTKVGVNAAIRNKVEMQADTDKALHPAVPRADVHLGDLVVSGQQSALQMLLLDQSVFTVGANARMKIDRFVYDPNKGTTDISASIAKGAFRFMSGHLIPGAGREAIRTPVATIGVRGTIVEGAVGQDAMDVMTGEPGIPSFSGDPNDAVLILLAGPGAGSRGFDKPGAIDVTGGNVTTAVDHGGNAMLFLPGQPLFGPFKLSDAAYARLTALLNPKPGQGEAGGPDVGSAAVGSGDILDIGNFDGQFLSDPQTIDLPLKVDCVRGQCH
jgi:hypothetical protein